MSWTQEYILPNLFELIQKYLLDTGVEERFLPDEIRVINYYLEHTRGLHIVEVREITLGSDDHKTKGKEIELSNGDIYRMVLKHSYANRKTNYGCDSYSWEKVKK